MTRSNICEYSELKMPQTGKFAPFKTSYKLVKWKELALRNVMQVCE